MEDNGILCISREHVWYDLVKIIIHTETEICWDFHLSIK